MEANEGLKMSRFGVAKFLKTYEETGMITRKPGSGRPSKVTGESKSIVDMQVKEDDETTAYQLHSLHMLSVCAYDTSLQSCIQYRRRHCQGGTQ